MILLKNNSTLFVSFESIAWLILLFVSVSQCKAHRDRVLFDAEEDNKNAVVKRNLFDQDLYENALDSELCDRQLSLIFSNVTNAAPFLDAGMRVPRGILEGNLVDLGNYHQCLAIKQYVEDTTIEGKYCTITIPLDQQENVLELLSSEELPLLPEELMYKIKEYERIKKEVQILTQSHNAISRITEDMSIFSALGVTLAFCIPKTCRTHQALAVLAENLEFTENFCRLPGDKLNTPVDYAALSIFSVIGILVIASTCYDLLHNFVFKKDPKETSVLFSSFSVYTNTRRLLTFKSGADSLDCLDGVRAITILWVIVGHTHSTAAQFPVQNPLTVLEWRQTLNAIWILSAPLSVDTFLMMSGLLCSYTVAKKATRLAFLKNVPMFYLHRYLRMFPLLAAAILLQMSLAHHIADGPIWTNVARDIEFCRENWWAALLHVQNYVSYGAMCIGHTWYLSVDMQLYWLSPLVLVWLCAPRRGGGLKTGWCAITFAVLASLLAAAIYCFLNDFPPQSMIRLEESDIYMKYYYVNTLTRAPPFFIGMLFGYILHLTRYKRTKLSKMLICMFWVLAASFLAFSIFIHNPPMQADYDNQLLDNFTNSFMRSFWATAVGWVVFACKHGYAGPINWLLSLRLWKLPARLSYAMYLLHMTQMTVMNDMQLAPVYFTQWNMIFRFFADLVLIIALAFAVTLAVDSPFSTLIKLILDKGKSNKSQREPVPKKDESSSSPMPKSEELNV